MFFVAFDTIDHSILRHWISSWFKIIDIAFICFKTYLSFCSFTVLTCGITSSPIPNPVAYLRAVLVPILFNIYKTPLNTLIASSWSLNHHIYANDTHLQQFISFAFISFAPKTFVIVSQLQDTISDISFG